MQLEETVLAERAAVSTGPEGGTAEESAEGGGADGARRVLILEGEGQGPIAVTFKISIKTTKRRLYVGLAGWSTVC